MLAALALALLLVAPAAWSGTADDPEVEDPSGDATVETDLTGDFAGMVDIVQAWIVKDDPDLTFDVQVDGSSTVSFDEAGTTVDATWHMLFTGEESTWRIQIDGSSNVQLFRDGSEVEDADLSGETSGDTATMTWSGAVDELGQEAVLTEVHAYTKASDSNDVDCHGEMVVDCGPDDPDFGRDFEVAGAAADLVFDVSPSSQTIEKGSVGVFDVTVANEGNETLNVSLSSDEPESWNSSFVPENLTIAGGSANASSFNVLVPDDAETGSTNLTISATVGDDAISRTVTVNVTNATTGGGSGNPYEFSASTTEKTTRAGEPIAYDVVISNVGDEADSYSIHVDDGQKSWVSFSESQFDVDAGESATISVQIEPPAATGVGTYEHLIGVHPLSDPTDTKEVTLTTTVEEGGAGDGDDGGSVFEDLLGTGQQRTIALSALGAVVLLVVIIALVVLKRRSDRRFYGEDEGDDEDHIYRP